MLVGPFPLAAAGCCKVGIRIIRLVEMSSDNELIAVSAVIITPWSQVTDLFFALLNVFDAELAHGFF